MKKIYKYTLKILEDHTNIPLPLDCEILSVAEQHGEVVVYALVDPNFTATQHYDFRVFGTGNEIRDGISNYKFLGTVSMNGGHLMLHVFYTRC